jgi:hypothetical protein
MDRERGSMTASCKSGISPWLIAVALLAACGARQASAAPVQHGADASRDGAHDFDFEFGGWHTHIRRLLHPLTGSVSWVDYDGSSVVHAVWNGRANLGELNVSGPAGTITGLSLRLYDPTAHQWRISWANAANGMLTAPPMVGGFNNGRGEFYDQEPFGERTILTRFIFSDIRPNSFHLEQAFSADGGKSWETNWISDFSR